MSVENLFGLILLSALPFITLQCFDSFTQGKRFNEISFETIKRSNLFSCAAECMAYSICKSLSFDKTSMTCYLHLTDDSERPAQLLSEESFFYVAIKDVNNALGGPCPRHKCEKYQKCRVKRGQQQCLDMKTLLSYKKTATASSSYNGDPEAAAVAVDGNKATSWSTGSCFHIGYDEFTIASWWQVDLGSEALITDVLIVNREGNEDTTGRLRNFNLEAFTNNPSVNLTAEARLCYNQPDETLAPGEHTLNCATPVIGRYFRVAIHNPLDKNFVQLCEVEVYGWLIE